MELKSFLTQKITTATLDGELSSNELGRIVEEVETFAAENGYSLREVHDAFMENEIPILETANSTSIKLLDQTLAELELEMGSLAMGQLHASVNTTELIDELSHAPTEHLTSIAYDVYSDVESRFSSADARAYLGFLIQNTPGLLDRLNLNEREFFGDLMSQTNSHLKKIEEIWVGQTGDIGLIDVDLNGKITSEDLALYIENGTYQVKPIGERAMESLKLAKAIADAAETMGGSDVEFIDIQYVSRDEFFSDKASYNYGGTVPSEEGEKHLYYRQQFNSEFWETQGAYAGVVREDVRPSEAIDDIVLNGSEYMYECATAMVAVYYLALKNHMGAEAFDEAFQGMALSGWYMPENMREVTRDGVPSAPGERGYIENDATLEGDALGWTGENVIYVGKSDAGEPLYYGHPFGLSTEEEIISFLKEYSADSGSEPHLLTRKYRLDGAAIE